MKKPILYWWKADDAQMFLVVDPIPLGAWKGEAGDLYFKTAGATRDRRQINQTNKRRRSVYVPYYTSDCQRRSSHLITNKCHITPILLLEHFSREI